MRGRAEKSAIEVPAQGIFKKFFVEVLSTRKKCFVGLVVTIVAVFRRFSLKVSQRLTGGRSNLDTFNLHQVPHSLHCQCQSGSHSDLAHP